LPGYKEKRYHERKTREHAIWEEKLMKMNKETAEHYIWGNVCDGWHLVKQPELSVIHERMPAGSKEVRHYHERSRQFFFVLSGTATLEMNGDIHTLCRHEGVEVASGVPHQMRNDSSEDVEFLVISQPTTRGDRIHVE
jgi:mannose-6-phosphate isomerase-like protein (cupin superfamily)